MVPKKRSTKASVASTAPSMPPRFWARNTGSSRRNRSKSRCSTSPAGRRRSCPISRAPACCAECCVAAMGMVLPSACDGHAVAIRHSEGCLKLIRGHSQMRHKLAVLDRKPVRLSDPYGIPQAPSVAVAILALCCRRRRRMASPPAVARWCTGPPWSGLCSVRVAAPAGHSHGLATGGIWLHGRRRLHSSLASPRGGLQARMASVVHS